MNKLDALIRKNILSNCRTQSIVLVGYSLGAWVINDWLSKHDDIWPNIIAVELYGDPLWEHWIQSGFYAGLAYGGVQNALNPRPYENPQGPGTGISDRWQSRCLQNDPVCGEGYPMVLGSQPLHQLEQVADAVACANTLCEHRKYTDENGNYEKLEYVPTMRGADWLASNAYPHEPASTTPDIVQVETFREGELVFFRAFFTNPNNGAEGFGFRGTNGSGWAEENHPFTNPSYGRVSLDVLPAKIEYPFNLGCGTQFEYESDVEAWIYDRAGLRISSVSVHLACSAPSEVVTPFPIPSTAP